MYDSYGNDITCMKNFDALAYPCKECDRTDCEERESYNDKDKEQCINCNFCCTLYTPPTVNTDAQYDYCCTLFLEKYSEITNLGKCWYDMCECFCRKE